MTVFLKKGIENRIGQRKKDALVKFNQDSKVREEIKVIETVFFLWSGISEAIHFAKKKEGYLRMRLGIGKEEYLEYACSLLLRSIEK